jgi:hypothetical protein
MSRVGNADDVVIYSSMTGMVNNVVIKDALK